jgi:hypothetical protein
MTQPTYNFTPISGVPGDVQTNATGINNYGVIVGYGFGPNNPSDFFEYSGGVYTLINPHPVEAGPGTTGGINDLGQFVGYRTTLNVTPYIGFYYDGTTFSVSGGEQNSDINNSGVIVGTYPAGLGHPVPDGFLDVGGQFTTNDDPLGLGKVART